MRTIYLTQGQVALVDDHNFEWLNRHKWQAKRHGKTWYAVRREGDYKIAMHRQILGLTDPTIETDHRDRNGLNNQEHNLRVATGVQNNTKRGVLKNNTSGYVGVSRSGVRWRVRIKTSLGRLCIGTFDCPKEAAVAYDKVAWEHFGEFAHLNFPR